MTKHQFYNGLMLCLDRPEVISKIANHPVLVSALASNANIAVGIAHSPAVHGVLDDRYVHHETHEELSEDVEELEAHIKHKKIHHEHTDKSAIR